MHFWGPTVRNHICLHVSCAIVVVGASWNEDEVEQSPCLPEMKYKLWEVLKPLRLSSHLSGLCCVREPMWSDAGQVWLKWILRSLSSLILQRGRQSVIFIYLFAAFPWQFWNFWLPVIHTHSWENRCLPPCAITAVIWVDYQTTQQVPATAVSISREQSNLVRLGDRFIWSWHWDLELVLKRTLIDFQSEHP